LADKLTAIDGVKLTFDQPFFNEFALTLPQSVKVEEVLDDLKGKGILGGIDLSTAYPELGSCILVAVTEMNPVAELDHFAEVLAATLAAKAVKKKVLTV
jgi:glycine dehydrogenase subunit 1